jgi:hypothetical protein
VLRARLRNPLETLVLFFAIAVSTAAGTDCHFLSERPQLSCTVGNNGLLTYTPKIVAQKSRIQQWLEGLTVSLPFDRSVALLVGIGDYANPPLNKIALPSKNDVAAMRDFLLLNEKFDVVYILLDADATPARIDNLMMTDLAQSGKVQSGDRFLFYFTGHGTDFHADVGYMLFSNYAGKFDHDTALPVDDVGKWSMALPAKHVLYLLDGCSLGLGISKDPSVLERRAGDGSRFAYTATRGNEAARAQPGGLSFFTAAFLDVARNGLADKSQTGFMTIDAIANEVENRLAQKVGATQDYYDKAPARLKSPKFIHNPGNFIFVNPTVNKGVDLRAAAIQFWLSIAKSDDVGQAYMNLPLEARPLDPSKRGIAGGMDFQCAIIVGSVYCSGADYRRIVAGNALRPKAAWKVPLPRAAHSISANFAHTCALLVDSKIACWGFNSSGQVNGDPTETVQLAATVDLGEPAVQVSAGGFHSCALGQSGKVYCWGGNKRGQQGLGLQDDSTHKPSSVKLPGPASFISAGHSQTCALVSKKAFCWGETAEGVSPSPKQIADAFEFNDISSGYKLFCGITSPEAGQQPTTLCTPSGGDLGSTVFLDRIHAGERLVCGLDGKGAAKCWDPTWSAAKPVELGGKYIDIAFSLDSSICAIDDNADVDCWIHDRVARGEPPAPFRTLAAELCGGKQCL